MKTSPAVRFKTRGDIDRVWRRVADCGNPRKFQMDGHVAALLAMTMLESSLLLSLNGSALVRAPSQ
jgi:hypothetical protein